MNNQETFSREFLQNMPEKHKNDMIESYLTNNITRLVIAAATENKTSYLFEITNELLRNQNPIARNNLGQFFRSMNLNLTIEDFIPVLKKKFPDCKINYVEKWVETPISLTEKKNVLKSGIEIDWS